MVLMLGLGGQGEEWGSEGGGELERGLTSHHWSHFSGPCVEVPWANPLYTLAMAVKASPLLPTHLAIQPLPRYLESSAPVLLQLLRQIWSPTLTLSPPPPPHCHKECEPGLVDHKGQLGP